MGIQINGLTDTIQADDGSISIGGTVTYEDVSNISFVGIATFTSDVLVADRVVHAGDTNTAIRFPAADTITAETGGSERLRITSAGLVGIGTDNPSSVFDVETGTGSGINFSSDGANAPTLNFMSGSVRLESAAQILVGENSGGGDFIIKTKNSSGSLTSRVSVNKDGNLTLGNTTINLPSGTGLQVYDASTPRLKLANSTTGVDSGSGSLLYVSGSDFLIENKESANMRFYTAATERMRIDSAGNMGLGTNSPGNALHIKNASPSIRLESSASGYVGRNNIGPYQNILYIDCDNDNAISNSATAFTVDGSEKLRITSGGQVNIGGNFTQTGFTSQITRNSTQTDILCLKGNAHNAFIRFQDTDSTSDFSLGSDDGSGSGAGSFVLFDRNNSAYRLHIDSSGRVLIGTTSPGATAGEQLTIAGSSNAGMTIRSSTTAAGSILFEDTASDRGEIQYSHNGDYMRFKTAGTERMRINSSGNMGIKTNNPQTPFVVSNSGADGIEMGYSSGSSSNYIQSYNRSTSAYGQLSVYADPIAFHVGGTERVRIDSVGRVMIGTTSRGQDSADDLTIGNASADAGITIRSSNSTTGNIFFSQTTSSSGGASYQGYIQYYQGTSRLYFGTGSTAKALIGQYGYFHASADGQFHGDLASTSSYHSFDTDLAQWTCEFRSRNSSSPAGVLINYSAASPNNSVNAFIYAQDQSAARFQVRSNGGIANFSANNANLCDEREKKNIVSLDAKWDKVKSWDLKKFHYNEDADTDDLRYGVIAQQVETVCPEVLTDWEKQAAAEAELDEDGNVITPAKEQILRKGVKEQQMMWMAIKALQEAQARIETLETQNADLLARITALEG